jgi:excisionase family DNA binding protein
MDKFISVAEAARQLGVSFWTVYRWVRAGRINSLYLGRRRIIAEKDMEAFIQQEQQGQKHNEKR